MIGMLTLLLAATASAQHVLVIFPHYFGANTYLYLDDYENFGWDVTTAGLTATVANCPWTGQFHASPMTVDLLLSDISDITEYDAVIITTASSYYGDPMTDLMGDQHTLDLLADAHDVNIPIAAYCSGVRVLAAAGVINGVTVSGNDDYLNEYINAGAYFAGEGVPPVLDHFIITGTRSMYYHLQNAEKIADAIELASIVDREDDQ